MLEVNNLSVDYDADGAFVHAVRNVNLKLNRSEVLCLVGESGCGKSTIALAIMRLLPNRATVRGGSILLEGQNILALTKEQVREFRGKKLAIIFQDPMTTLNPLESVKQHMIEALEAHESNLTDSEAKITSVLRSVGISPERIGDYAHQLSGGMRQRVMIALAILLNPQIIIADEPTTSLDVLVEAQILDILNTLKKELGVSILYITHNFGVVAQIADRVAVMYAGEIVEVGPVQEIFKEQLHPYTEALLKSVPNITQIHRRIQGIPGTSADVTKLENACTFRDRCPYAFDKCSNEKPVLTQLANGRLVSCHLRG